MLSEFNDQFNDGSTAVLRRVRSLGQVTVWSVGRVIWLAAIGAIPFLLENKKMGEAQTFMGFQVNVVAAWVFMYTATVIYDKARQGRSTVRWSADFRRRMNRLGGNIDAIAAAWLKRPPEALARHATVQIVGDLLKDVVEAVTSLIPPGSDELVSACLLIPEKRPASIGRGSRVLGLKAVTFDSAVGGRYPAILAESPSKIWRAYDKNEPCVIPDVQSDGGSHLFDGLPYRSVVVFPVRVEGKVFGVVAVNATRPNFFRVARVRQLRLDEAVCPFLNLIGMVETLNAEDRHGDRHGR